MPHSQARRASPLLFALLPLLILGLVLRFYSLNADPDWRLDWNPGLLTDEAFYMHNARNEVLFGNAQQDEFNNMVLSPIIHWIQVQVFERFGVGYVQGRAVAVLFSLLTLLVFYRLLLLMVQLRLQGQSEKSSFASYLPYLGVCWLAYEHAFLLFNRTALLETPTAFFCIASLWAFAESLYTRRRSASWMWGVLSGVIAVLALATKMTAILYVMALLAVSLRSGLRPAPVRLSLAQVPPASLPLLAGFFAALAVWFFVWLLPSWAEFSRMQSYYLMRQGRAENLWGLWLSVQRALVGERYGMSQFFFLHLPLVWTFNLLLFAALTTHRRLRASFTPVEWIFILWVLLSWLQMATIRIAPTRYTVAFMPAMVALLMIALLRWDDVRLFLQDRASKAWLTRTLVFAWILYFAMMQLLPSIEWRGLEFPIFNTEIQVRLLLMAAILAGVVSYLLASRHKSFQALTMPDPPLPAPRAHLSPALLLLISAFVLLNTHWYVQYFGKRTYQMETWNRSLRKNLPPNSVIVGIAFETPFRYFFVFNGLCNWREPLSSRGATHMMLIGSEETLFRFWTNSDNLEKWYSHYSDQGFARQFKAQGRVGPYQIRLYRLPDNNAPAQSSANAVLVR